MFKIKKKSDKLKPVVLYNVIEDYSEFDAPGNVTACAMTIQEDLAAHAKVLSESYEIPLETMKALLTDGGVYVYPQVGGVLTRGLFACRIDPTGERKIALQEFQPHVLGRVAFRRGVCQRAARNGQPMLDRFVEACQ